MDETGALRDGDANVSGVMIIQEMQNADTVAQREYLLDLLEVRLYLHCFGAFASRVLAVQGRQGCCCPHLLAAQGLAVLDAVD